MPRGAEDDIFAKLEEISVSLHHRSGRGVEGFKQAVVKLDCGIGVVGRGKPRRGALNAERRLECEPRRKFVRVGTHNVALPVDVLNTERRIDRCLVGIRRGAHQIVKDDACKELVFGREPVIDAKRKLVGICRHFRCRRIGVLLEGAREIIRQRITLQQRRNPGIDRNCQRVDGAVGIGQCILP